MLNNEGLEKYKTRLEEERTAIEKELVEFEKMPDFGSDVTELQDEEADEAEEFSTNEALAKAHRERLMEINEALQRMAAGQYGKCEKCGRILEKEILDITPESRLCRNCKLGK